MSPHSEPLVALQANAHVAGYRSESPPTARPRPTPEPEPVTSEPSAGDDKLESPEISIGSKISRDLDRKLPRFIHDSDDQLEQNERKAARHSHEADRKLKEGSEVYKRRKEALRALQAHLDKATAEAANSQQDVILEKYRKQLGEYESDLRSYKIDLNSMQDYITGPLADYLSAATKSRQRFDDYKLDYLDWINKVDGLPAKEMRLRGN